MSSRAEFERLRDMTFAALREQGVDDDAIETVALLVDYAETQGGVRTLLDMKATKEEQEA